MGLLGGEEEGTCQEVSTLLSAFGVKQDPDKVKLESRVHMPRT